MCLISEIATLEKKRERKAATLNRIISIVEHTAVGFIAITNAWFPLDRNAIVKSCHSSRLWLTVEISITIEKKNLPLFTVQEILS